MYFKLPVYISSLPQALPDSATESHTLTCALYWVFNLSSPLDRHGTETATVMCSTKQLSAATQVRSVQVHPKDK